MMFLQQLMGINVLVSNLSAYQVRYLGALYNSVKDPYFPGSIPGGNILAKGAHWHVCISWWNWAASECAFRHSQTLEALKVRVWYLGREV